MVTAKRGVSLINQISTKLYRLFKKAIAYLDQRVQILEASQLVTLTSSTRINNVQIVNPTRNPGLISLGEHTVVNGGMLYVFPYSGKISIGEHSFIGQNTKIWSACSIKIGNRVLVSHDVNIHDTNAHPVDHHDRHKENLKKLAGESLNHNEFGVLSEAVEIQDDVWVGFGSTILKGVKIGRASIIGAGSVVTEDIPEFVIAAGNPAKIIKNISRD
jgi:acetyltransferase-like isoleucine patch superfamily enzyme